MHAVLIHTTGNADVLSWEEARRPEPAEDEVLIQVHAAGVNPVDYKVRSGRFSLGHLELPTILGREVSGVVAATGDRVKDIQVGDEVYAMLARHNGGYAEFATAAVDEVAPKPKSLDHVHAAGVPLAALTVWQGLFDVGELRSGQRVLIHGAGGGVGHFAVQFAKTAGASVVATAATEDLDLVREWGADQVVDFRIVPFQDQVESVDLVFDLVAGETQDRSWSVLRDGGMLVSALGEPTRRLAAAARHATGKGFMVQPCADQLRRIGGLIDEGRVRVLVSKTVPLAEAREAHRHLETEHSQGKTVLAVA